MYRTNPLEKIARLLEAVPLHMTIAVLRGALAATEKRAKLAEERIALKERRIKELEEELVDWRAHDCPDVEDEADALADARLEELREKHKAEAGRLLEANLKLEAELKTAREAVKTLSLVGANEAARLILGGKPEETTIMAARRVMDRLAELERSERTRLELARLSP